MHSSATGKLNKLQVSIQLDADQAEALDQLAASRRVSRAAVVRAAVDLYLLENMDTLHSVTVHTGQRVAA